MLTGIKESVWGFMLPERAFIKLYTPQEDLIHRSDSVDDACQFITKEITERFLDDPGGRL